MHGTVTVASDQCLLNVHPKQGALRKYFHLGAVLLLYVMCQYILYISIFCRPMESRLPLSNVTSTIDSCVAKRSRKTDKNSSYAGRVCSFPILNLVILFIDNDNVQYIFLISVVLFIDKDSVQ